MKLHNNSATDPTQINLTLTRRISQVSLDEQARPAKRATLNIASETIKNAQAEQIKFHCEAIKKEIPLIQVETRRALSSFLTKNQIKNPGLLSKQQEDLCAWTLLEHAARQDEGFQNIHSTLVNSYIHPAEKYKFRALAHLLSLDPVQFVA